LSALLNGDTTATSYFYNLDRQITNTLRPDGIDVTVEYDTVGCGTCGPTARPKTITFDRGQLGFLYDPASGLLNALTAPGGNVLTYTYDGSMPTGVTWSGEVNGHVEVEYDNNFRVWRQTVNGGIDARYYYDHDGLLTLAGDMSITRDPQNGRLTGTQFGYVTTSQTYNSAGELATYEAKFRENTLFATTYTRDSLGRITQLDETVQGVSKTFRYAYDATGRLQKMWRNDTLISTYTYDSNGNRLSHTSLTGTVAGTYDSQDRLLTYGSTKYLYTTNGELQAKIDGNGTTRYTYDAFGNLVQVRMPNGDLIEYLIDAQNRRVGKKVNGAVVKRWLYEGQLRPVAELDSDGNVTARYVYGTKVNIPEYVIIGIHVYRVITDHLGSLRLLVDPETGTIAQRMDYDEWGNVLTDSNPDLTPFGFAGGMYDRTTKLTRFGARDYDEAVGRWISKDPIGFSGASPNQYSYVRNNPISLSDPSGLVPLSECVKKLLSSYFPELDLGEVEIEEGIPGIIKSLSAVDPSAFTFGNTIYFAPGEYNPHTAMGIALIAHELKHAEQYENYGHAAFELVYLGSYLYNKIAGMSDYDAYSKIPFEVPASQIQANVLSDLLRRYGNEDPCPKPCQ
jgi:RHS repeat-associated protein